MDSPTACGQRFPVAQDSVYVRPRGSVGVSNPPASCVIYFESSNVGSAYKFEIVVEAAQFRDCNIQLRVFEGIGVDGSWIRMFGCGTSSSTAQFYSNGPEITLQLTRTRDQYFFGNDFSVKLTVYKDPNSAAELIGTDKLHVGAIVGIVLALIVLIGMAILLGWCYKTGKLPGLNQDYPKSINADNIDKLSSVHMDTGHSNGNFVSWHGNPEKASMSESRSNFDLDNSQIWDSLTSLSANPKKPSNNNARSWTTQPVGRAPYDNTDINRDDTTGRQARLTTFSRTETAQLSNSPNTRARGRLPRPPAPDADDTYNKINNLGDKGELGLRGRGKSESSGPRSGLFENPDKEGYLYDYDQVKKLSSDPDDEKKETNIRPKSMDFATELKDAVKRNSMKRVNSEPNTSAQLGSVSEDPSVFTSNSQINDSELDSASALFRNKNTDGETTGPEAQSSPKPKKKKRKNSKSPKSKRKNKDVEGVKESPKAKPRRKTLQEENDLPPELYAPIFSDDDAANSEYQPDLYQPGYQPGYPGYGAGYPPGQPNSMYPMMNQYGPPGMPGMYPPGHFAPGAPYQQAGQAQWFMETRPNGQNKMAFAMTTHSQSSQDEYGDPGRPSHQSTPYNNQYPVAKPGEGKSLVPAGTILDDPQIPPPGTSLVRYDDDPITGIKTSQVIWADSQPDPTDPPPGSNPQVIRKTITRVTTRSTKDNLPDAPGPSLQEMSFSTAQEMQATGQEPAFMTPSRPRQMQALPHSSIQFATETPERSNAPYYENRHHVPQAIIHEPSSRNEAFKDRIKLIPERDVSSV